MWKSIEFHLTHYEIPQLTSYYWLAQVRMTYEVTLVRAFNGSKDCRKTFSNTNFGIREKSAQKL